MIVAAFFLNTYVAFFESYNSLLDSTSGYVVIVFSYLMDLFFITDFAFGFVTQIITANGKIYSHRAMALNFLRSSLCWVDLIAILPIEILAATLTQGAGEKDSDFYERQMHLLGTSFKET